MGKVINQKFNILMAFGIIAVVGMHTGFIFVDWLSNTWHIPLFVFISGYFFSERPFRVFCSKKVRHLLIPFLLWNAFYGVLINTLAEVGWTALPHQAISLTSIFWYPFTTGWHFWFNAASWFVGMLIPIQIFYWLLFKWAKGNFFIIMPILVGLHVISLYMAFHGYVKVNYDGWFPNWELGVSRVFHCLIFYYLGYLYRIYGEKRDAFSVNKIVGVLLLNALIMGFIKPQIGVVINTMTFPHHNYWIPFVVAVAGIWACIQVAEALQHYIKLNDLLSYIGRHSWDIMMHQFFFFWLLNTILFGLKYYGILSLNTFDYNLYMHNIYFKIAAYPPVNHLIYLIAGVMGPVVCCWLYEKYFKECVISIRSRIIHHINKVYTMMICGGGVKIKIAEI